MPHLLKESAAPVIDPLEFARGTLCSLSFVATDTARETHVTRLHDQFDRAGVAASMADALGTLQFLREAEPLDGGYWTPAPTRVVEVVGNLAHECGLILIVDGLAARIAAESWLGGGAGTGKVLECGIGGTDDSVVRAAVADAPDAIVILDANLSPLDVYARPLIDVVQRRLSGTGAAGIATKILMSISGGVAALPLPLVVESVSLRVSLDRVPTFLQESDVAARLEEIATSDELVGWFARIWKPAGARVVNHLRSMPSDEAALALSVLEAALVEPSA